jgi:hypothetical protein
MSNSLFLPKPLRGILFLTGAQSSEEFIYTVSMAVPFTVNETCGLAHLDVSLKRTAVHVIVFHDFLCTTKNLFTLFCH